jgi:hypothetical protein
MLTPGPGSGSAYRNAAVSALILSEPESRNKGGSTSDTTVVVCPMPRLVVSARTGAGKGVQKPSRSRRLRSSLRARRTASAASRARRSDGFS